MIDTTTKAKAIGRLRRIEGQVQGLQRMIDAEAYCVDILLQVAAVQGALEQVEKLLLGRHITSSRASRTAMRSGSKNVSARSTSGSKSSRASGASDGRHRRRERDRAGARHALRRLRRQ